MYFTCDLEAFSFHAGVPLSFSSCGVTFLFLSLLFFQDFASSDMCIHAHVFSPHLPYNLIPNFKKKYFQKEWERSGFAGKGLALHSSSLGFPSAICRIVLRTGCTSVSSYGKGEEVRQ